MAFQFLLLPRQHRSIPPPLSLNTPNWNSQAIYINFSVNVSVPLCAVYVDLLFAINVMDWLIEHISDCLFFFFLLSSCWYCFVFFYFCFSGFSISHPMRFCVCVLLLAYFPNGYWPHTSFTYTGRLVIYCNCVEVALHINYNSVEWSCGVCQRKLYCDILFRFYGDPVRD